MTAKTNIDLANAYKGSNNVSQILLGGNLVWPQSPIFEFETKRLLGDINFHVVSNRPYLGATVNRTDTYIYTHLRTISAIRAYDDVDTKQSETYTTSGANYKTYNMPEHKLTSETKYHHWINSDHSGVKIELSPKRSAVVRGRSSSKDYYLGDLSNGEIRVEIFNQSGNASNFEVRITPGVTVANLRHQSSTYNTAANTTQTKNIARNRTHIFKFNSLIGASGSGRTYTVRVKDLSTGTAKSTTVKIKQDRRRKINTQNIDLGGGGINPREGLADDDESGTIISLYALTEEEAFTSLFGGNGVIEMAYIDMGNEFVGRWTYYGGSKTASGNAILAKVRKKLTGQLPTNKTIKVYLRVNKLDSDNDPIANTYTMQIPVFNVITDSYGNVDRIEYPSVSDRTNDKNPSQIQTTHTGTALGRSETNDHAAGNWLFYPGGNDTLNRLYITYGDEPEWSNCRLLESRIGDSAFAERYSKDDGRRGIPEAIKAPESGTALPITQDYDIGIWLDDIAAAGGPLYANTTYPAAMLDGSTGKPYVPYDGSNLTIVGVGDELLFGDDTPEWTTNLLVDNENIEGNIVSVELGSEPIRSITVGNQRNLSLIQSDYINTSNIWPNFIDNAFLEGKTGSEFRPPNRFISGKTQIYGQVKSNRPPIVIRQGSAPVYRYHDSDIQFTYFPGPPPVNI